MEGLLRVKIGWPKYGRPHNTENLELGHRISGLYAQETSSFVKENVVHTQAR